MERLPGYCHSRFKSLHKQLEKCKVVLYPQTLHQIRIELKRIKTVYRLLDFYIPRFKYSKEYKPLRKIFRQAGYIRNTDILHQLHIKYKIKKQEKNMLEMIRKENKQIAEFRQNVAEYIKIIEKQEVRTKKYSKELNSRELRDYYVRKDNALHRKLSQRFNEDKLHALRKRCKEIIYLSKMGDDKKSVGHLKLYMKLQDLIGQWRDKKILIESLKENNANANKKSIPKLKTDCEHDLKKIKPLTVKLQS